MSFLLTKEWSKFASDVEARNLIGVIMRWVHEIQSLLSLLKAHIHLYIYIYINIDTLQDVEGEMSRVSKKKNKLTNEYVINQKHTVKSERISQIK